jgi:hypothetical protein
MVRDGPQCTRQAIKKQQKILQDKCDRSSGRLSAGSSQMQMKEEVPQENLTRSAFLDGEIVPLDDSEEDETAELRLSAMKETNRCVR